MRALIPPIAVLVLVGASAGFAQDVKALVQDLRHYPMMPAARKAAEVLLEMSAEAVAAEVSRVLAADPAFPKGCAYEFLWELVKARLRKDQPLDRVLLEQLKAGVSESAGSIRLVAVKALACAQKDVQEEVAGWIAPALEDPSLDVAEEAARALERFARRAARAAPALLKLLEDPDEATRKRWAIPANGPYELFGKLYHTGDYELRARMAAARARIAVLESLTDFDLYPKLDEKGRLAGAMGMISEQGLALVQKDAARARQAVVLVTPLLDSTQVNKDMGTAPIMIWFVVARCEGHQMSEARAEATARLEDASKSANDRIRAAAAQALAMLKNPMTRPSGK